MTHSPLLAQQHRHNTGIANPFESPEDLREEVARFAAMRPSPVSLQEVLGMLEPWRAAKFIHHEVPVRYAERIRSIEAIPDWKSDPDLVDVHERHCETFRDIRLIKTYPKKSTFSLPELVDDFTEVVRSAVDHQKGMVLLVAKAMHRLQKEHGDALSPGFVDNWLDSFLLNLIGSSTLLSQYLAVIDGNPTGIVDPSCNIKEVCQEAAEAVKDLCADTVGRTPHIVVESFSAAGDDLDNPMFSYIPSYLTYIIVEILKNSSRATLENYGPTELRRRAISVVVCADERRVAIRVADRAKGIPFDVGSKIWSYLYSTARKGSGLDGGDASELAGYGVGLPISRLYARYLGGSLDLIAWPGYGTDTYLNFPRLSSELKEVVPDEDNE